MNSERVNHTLTPTALVHEAYIRLIGAAPGDDAYYDHAQYFSATARAMRNVLIDFAHRKKSQKQGGKNVVLSLEDRLIGEDPTDANIEALDEALTKLEQQHPDLCELVSLRYFAGMTMPQAATVLGISLRTAERNWHLARAWLRSELAEAQTTE